MRREQFRTPEEEVTAEFERVCRLFRLALGEPPDRVLFDALMADASERGLNWVQGLEYVVEHRRGMLAGTFPAERAKSVSSCVDTGWSEGLRRAG